MTESATADNALGDADSEASAADEIAFADDTGDGYDPFPNRLPPALPAPEGTPNKFTATVAFVHGECVFAAGLEGVVVNDLASLVGVAVLVEAAGQYAIVMPEFLGFSEILPAAVAEKAVFHLLEKVKKVSHRRDCIIGFARVNGAFESYVEATDDLHPVGVVVEQTGKEVTVVLEF